MKNLFRLPLYLGLAVFIISVLVSATKVSQQRNLASLNTRATGSQTLLTLRYSSFPFVNVTLQTERKINIVNVVLSFDKNKIEILPSTLISGPSFNTTKGLLDEENSTFSFTAISAETSQLSKGRLVATFQVTAKHSGAGGETELEFLTGRDQTSVIEETTGRNILTETEGVSLNLSPQ